MTTATSNLENDHVHILRLIDVMEKMTLKDAVDVSHLEAIVDLIRNYADGLHHAKEENLLFPKMVEKGFSFQQGPIAVMMHDHTVGRNYVKGIADNIPLYRTGNQLVLSDIFSNMRGYIDLLRAHIGKENNVLFRMADNALSADEQHVLLNQFNTIENAGVNGGSLSDCISKIDQLTHIYNV